MATKRHSERVETDCESDCESNDADSGKQGLFALIYIFSSQSEKLLSFKVFPPSKAGILVAGLSN